MTLTCRVLRGNPAPYNFIWYHYNHSTILESRTTSERVSVLHLPLIQHNDSGIYKCSVTNIAGTGTADIFIFVGGEMYTKLHTVLLSVHYQFHHLQYIFQKF